MKRCVLGLVFGLMLGADVEAGDWPEWRGPNREGKSAETGLLQTWPSDGPKQVWRIDGVGGGYSTPAVVGDRLYLAANEGLENEYVRALDAKDGSTIWSTRIGKVGAPKQRPSYPGSRAMPTIDDDRVYAVGSNGDLVCLNRKDGKMRWHINFTEAFGSKAPRWAWAESPLIDGEKLIATPGGSDAAILAVDKMTGKLLWKAKLPQNDEAGYGSPVKATISGVDQYVVFMQKGVVGVDAKTGAFLWQYGATAESSPANILTPVVYNDHVFTGTNRGGSGLVRVDLDADPKVTEIYKKQKLPMHVGGAVLLDGYLYGTTRSALVCSDFMTGEVAWTDRSVGAATVGYADGRIYVVGDEGEIALIDPSPEGYKEVGRFTPGGRDGGGTSWTYPVIANGRMYVRNLDRLWCFDVSAE